MEGKDKISFQLGKINEKLENLIKLLKESRKNIFNETTEPQIGQSGTYNKDEKSEK